MDTTETAQARPIKRRLLNILEAAEYLRCCPTIMRRLIWDGKISEVRISRRVFVDIKDLDAFIDGAKRNALLG